MPKLASPDGGKERVRAASIHGDILDPDIIYAGECEEHRFGLCYVERRIDHDDIPYALRRVELFVAHDRGGDFCGQSPSRRYRRRARDLGFDGTSPIVVHLEAWADGLVYAL